MTKCSPGVQSMLECVGMCTQGKILIILEAGFRLSCEAHSGWIDTPSTPPGSIPGGVTPIASVLSYGTADKTKVISQLEIFAIVDGQATIFR